MPRRMADHWWWRPGWRAGRRMYTFHITFNDQLDVRKLAGSCQEALRGLSGLDLVPPRWLHLTVQGVGFTDEVSVAEADAITEAARARLARHPVPRVTLGPVIVTPEAITLPVKPVAAITPLREELRAAILEVWPPERLMESDTWSPHVTVAYSNDNGPAAPFRTALELAPGTADAQVRSIELIILGRDQHAYEWTLHAAVPVGGEAG